MNEFDRDTRKAAGDLPTARPDQFIPLLPGTEMFQADSLELNIEFDGQRPNRNSVHKLESVTAQTRLSFGPNGTAHLALPSGDDLEVSGKFIGITCDTDTSTFVAGKLAEDPRFPKKIAGPHFGVKTPKAIPAAKFQHKGRTYNADIVIISNQNFRNPHAPAVIEPFVIEAARPRYRVTAIAKPVAQVIPARVEFKKLAPINYLMSGFLGQAVTSTRKLLHVWRKI